MTMEPIYDPQATTIPVLRYLVAIAEHRHFGRAAEACRVAQPTLSAQIAQWEKRLDLRVFERGAAGVQVTPAGERVVAAARAALEALERVEAAATASKPPFFGPVRLGVIPTVGPYLLPRACPALEKTFPDLDLPIREATTDELLHLLDRGRVDVLMLAELPGMDAGRHVMPLYDEPLLVALPKGHRLAKQKSITSDDLAGERLLLLEDGHCLRQQALSACHQQDGERRSGANYRATSIETLRQLVILGLGCTILPALAVDPDDASLVIRPLDDPHAVRTIALVHRQGDSRADAYAQLAPAVRRNLPKERVKVR
jgi:LysR family hydrogen peroxide-inducible transcriptional activator